MKMKDRVKFFSQNDLCYGLHLDKIETIKIPDSKDVTINDAIEFNEIKRYFDDGARSQLWDDGKLNEYKKKSGKLDSLCKRFFNQIADGNIMVLYNDIEFGYHSEFWRLFDDCKLYNKISDDVFETLLNHDRVSPYDVFKYKNIVRKYGKILREYILNNDFCVPVILHVYEQDYTGNEKLMLPTELTGEDICNYLEAYIDSEKPNTNYLSDIENMRCTKEFPITDEIRLKAKRKYDVEMKKHLETGVHIEYGINVSFDPKQDEVVLVDDDKKMDFSISYGTKWLEETLDYSSILNNFIYVFEFVDLPQVRSLHVSKKSQSGVLEDVFLSKSSRYYHCNQAFRHSQVIAMLQMTAYYDFLLKRNIRLENVLHWFFTEYLQEEFSVPEMRVSFPSESATFSEKCSTIITAFETIIKQFVIYRRHGSIDFDLLAMSTTPISFENINSLVDNKYAYGNGADYEKLSFMLFSNQCMFSFVDRIYKEGRHYDSFVDLLLNENVFLSDYRDEERASFGYLESFDLISIEEKGKIELKDKAKVAVLRDLYINDVVNPKHYSELLKKSVEELAEKGVLIEESTLFSRPEVNYLNYMLNRSEYVNGLEIRNKYIHGIQQVNMNEEEHKRNYYTLLGLFVLLAIKINDEFCLLDDMKE